MTGPGHQHIQASAPRRTGYADVDLSRTERAALVLALVFFLLAAFVQRPRREHVPLAPARTAVHLAGVALPAASPYVRGLPPVLGAERRYTTRAGDTLLKIARRAGTDPYTLARLNDLPGVPRRVLRAGTILSLPSRYILPAVVSDGLVLNIPERAVYVFRARRLLARFPVAVGRRTWETPVGRFRLVQKVVDPIWLPPEEMMRREGTPDVAVPAGARNPLGDRWMGWSAPEVGFHSTSAVDSVGKPASHACVRMYPEAAHRMFDWVQVGMPIFAVYKPVKIGRGADGFYLSVSPDIYARGVVSAPKVREALRRAGLAARLDAAQVRRIVARKDGYPHRVLAVPFSPGSGGRSLATRQPGPRTAMEE